MRKTKGSFEDYLRQLADETQALSIASLYQLSGLDEDNLALFELAWPAVPARRRREILRHLVDITEINFEMECDAVFGIGLTDDDPEVREAAIDGLWISEDVKQVSPLLRMMLHDPAARVRAAAAGSLARYVLLNELGKIPPRHQVVVRETLAALRATIANSQETLDVRRRAVEAIAYSSEDDVPGIIREAYNSPDSKMRASALCGMGRSADNQWQSAVIKELESSNPELRYEAARAAGELETRKAVPLLGALLDDPDREVRSMAVWALGQIGGTRARQLLQKCCEEGDEELGEAASEAIEEMAMMRGVDLPLFVFDPLDEGEPDLDEFELEQDLDE